VARHWLFLVFVLGGAAMRALVALAYRPALELFGDSFTYLYDAAHPTAVAQVGHPVGYSIFLRAFFPTGSIGAVTDAQHVLGLAMGVLLYVLLLRLGVRRTLAALATLPILLDGYQLDIEQFIMAETVIELLLVAGMAILLWRRRVKPLSAGVAGLVLVAAALTRLAAFPVLLCAALYLLLRRYWRPLLVYAGVCAAALTGYSMWFTSASGYSGLSAGGGYQLYGRVAPFATCHYPMPRKVRRLCPALPVSLRSHNLEFYVWDPVGSPLYQPGLGTPQQRNALAEKFFKEVVIHQPLQYAGVVAGDTWHYFTPGHWMTPGTNTIDMQRWRFPSRGLQPYRDQLHVFFGNHGLRLQPIRPHLDVALFGPLRRYQSIAYTEGPLLLACLVGAGMAGIGLVRRRAGRRHARWAGLLLAASGLVLLLTPSLAAGFSYRYALPVLVLLPPAGALAADLGLDALTSRLGRMGAGRRGPAGLVSRAVARPSTGGLRPDGGAGSRTGLAAGGLLGHDGYGHHGHGATHHLEERERLPQDHQGGQARHHGVARPDHRGDGDVDEAVGPVEEEVAGTRHQGQED
jgi:hypothetical protein